MFIKMCISDYIALLSKQFIHRYRHRRYFRIHILIESVCSYEAYLNATFVPCLLLEGKRPQAGKAGRRSFLLPGLYGSGKDCLSFFCGFGGACLDKFCGCVIMQRL